MLPKQLKYGSKTEAAWASSYRTNIAPQNGLNSQLGQTIIINIPTAKNLVLATTESYLKFGVGFLNTINAVQNANVFRWDSCGAHGLIQRIRIFHGSNLLQDIDNYSLLAKMLFDLQVSTDACYGRMNNLIGTRSDLYVNGATALQVNSGEGFNLPAIAINTSPGYTNSDGNNMCLPASVTNYSGIPVRYYCLNLISLLGSLSPNNYFPLFACTSAPLRLEIQLVSSSINAGLDITGLAIPALYNIEYIANFIKLSDAAEQIIYNTIPPETPLQFCVNDYSNYQYTYALGTGTTQVNFPIPAKYSSLKSIFVTIRDKGTGALTFFPCSSVTANITSYYFRVGSQIMPTKAPDNLTEMFAETMKAMGSLSDLNYQPSIEKLSYETQSSTLATPTIVNTNGQVNSGSFYIGLDLENYVSASKDTIFCGYNSNTDDIFAVLTFGGTTGALAVTNTRFDAFAMFDSVIVFEAGTCYRKF